MKENAKQVINDYMKQIYSFVKNRVSNEQDALDLTQDICLNIYKALCVKEVYSVESFVFTVARHVLANYYRDNRRIRQNVSYDSEEYIENEAMQPIDIAKSPLEQMLDKDDYKKIRSEIAYLSKIQRRIVIMYYYEEKKLTEIAEILGIPLGTVKWHLNIAKGELKKGMDKMRNKSDLKFNPIEFGTVFFSGSTGDMGNAKNFFRSALSQNIIYMIRKEEHTVEEIADALNVSPVYVESELEFLEEYSMVIKIKDRYISNILVEEVTGEGVENHQKLYEKVSSEIANELYDRIIDGGYLDSPDICGENENHIMWSLIFYLLSQDNDSGEKKIKFDDVAVLRADGGKNYINADIKNEVEDNYMQSTGMYQQCGPCWNENEYINLWLIDNEYTGKRVTQHYGGPNIERDLSLLYRFWNKEQLSPEDMAYLIRKNYIIKDKNGYKLALVVLKEGETRDRMLKLTSQVKEKYLAEEADTINKYKKEVLEKGGLPKHLKKQQEFALQYMFSSDGWFMLYARKALLESGRLKSVEGQHRESLNQMIIIK